MRRIGLGSYGHDDRPERATAPNSPNILHGTLPGRGAVGRSWICTRFLRSCVSSGCAVLWKTYEGQVAFS